MAFLRQLLVVVAVFQCLTFFIPGAVPQDLGSILSQIDLPCPPENTFQEVNFTDICQCSDEVCPLKDMSPSRLCVCNAEMVLGPEMLPYSECPFTNDMIWQDLCRMLTPENIGNLIFYQFT